MSTVLPQPLKPALSYSNPRDLPIAPKARLASLDIFRGATIAMMLLVNNPGSEKAKYAPLDHAAWHGWTPTDLVFPFFLFIMGVAIPFSMAKRSATQPKGTQFVHILVRGLSLFLLGEFGYSIPNRDFAVGPTSVTIARWVGVIFLAIGFVLLLYPWKSIGKSLWVPPIVGVAYLLVLLLIYSVNHRAASAGAVSADFNYGAGLFNPDKLRIPGVLQRIGICYVVAASIALIGSWHVLLLAAVAFMAGYSWLMLKVPYPSLTHPGQTVHGLLGEHDNLGRFVDTHVLGKHVYPEYPDPEGIVSTLPAIGTALLGILAGIWLRSERSPSDRCAGLLAAGVLTLCVGAILHSTFMPINKRLWTPSFTVFCAGAAMLGLGMVFYVADVLMYRRWALPFTIYGMNAIAAFVLAGIVARLISSITIRPAGTETPITLRKFLVEHAAELSRYVHIGNPSANASLAFALGYVLFFLLLMSIFYVCKVFLKV